MLAQMTLVVAVFIVSASGLANCPPGCECNDNTLVVQCGQGQLDILPIALNPSIKRLIIKRNKIRVIDSSIQFYADLLFLDLSWNHLVSIPQRTFLYQKKLQDITLSYNKIAQISNKTFLGLSAVTRLNLCGNHISELHQSTFVHMSILEELNLGENRIAFIDPRAFEGLSQLRVLRLDDNALTSLPDPTTFQKIPSLAELFLGRNALSEILPGAFKDLNLLISLKMEEAGLQNISQQAFENLGALRTLDISGNRLLHVPTLSLQYLVQLENLLIGRNNFENIAEGALVGLAQLRHLDVSGSSSLKTVLSGAFSTNKHLEFLNMSYNKLLVDIQEGAFSGLAHLHHLLLKGNSLTIVAEGLFSWNNLITLDISENPIACDCRMMWLANLIVSKNNTNATVSDVVCVFPDSLYGKSIKGVSSSSLGCLKTDRHALVGALIVALVAIITALTLIIYSCRKRIRDNLKGRKESEYQKTFCNEDYTSRNQRLTCGLGVHTNFSNVYTTHFTDMHHYRLCTQPVIELGARVNQSQGRKASELNRDNLSRDSAASKEAAINASSDALITTSRNPYTKLQCLVYPSNADDSFYSYADVPVVHSYADFPQKSLLAQMGMNQQLCPSHSETSPYDGTDIVDSIYGNSHYAKSIDHIRRQVTPPPSLQPPALPQRNSGHSLLQKNCGARDSGIQHIFYNLYSSPQRTGKIATINATS